jgi:hypothetical protein
LDHRILLLITMLLIELYVFGLHTHVQPAACSIGWWLMVGAGLFWEKSTAGWLVVAGLF